MYVICVSEIEHVGGVYLFSAFLRHTFATASPSTQHTIHHSHGLAMKLNINLPEDHKINDLEAVLCVTCYLSAAGTAYLISYDHRCALPRINLFGRDLLISTWNHFNSRKCKLQRFCMYHFFLSWTMHFYLLIHAMSGKTWKKWAPTWQKEFVLSKLSQIDTISDPLNQRETRKWGGRGAHKTKETNRQWGMHADDLFKNTYNLWCDVFDYRF